MSRSEADINLVPVGAGALALTHRLKVKDLPALGTAGATHLITLLAENEGARDVGAAAQRAGLEWVWLPMSGAAVPDRARDDEFRAVLEHLRDLIQAGNHLVLHCSAGIHRTGMVGYALLRQLMDAEKAHELLAQLREITADGVGPDRLAWGDALAHHSQPPS